MRDTTGKKRIIRHEIQGFRALCITQVLLFHAWAIGSPIGVDVFIMISAYLLAASFIRRSEAGTIPFFLSRIFHIFKRLLPPLVVTILLTIAGVAVYLPPSRFTEVISQAWASLFYLQNWYLQNRLVDYFAADHSTSSPLMHLWSMSMQGQVFVIFTFVLWIGALLAKKLGGGKRYRHLALLFFSIMGLASFSWLLWHFFNGGTQNYYFDTRGRLWEFSLGAILAVLEPKLLKLPPVLSHLMGWLGCVVVLLFGMVSIGTYPGPMALCPMLGAALVLLYARGDAKASVAWLLKRSLLVYVGNRSYVLYLIHWPLMAISLGITGDSHLGRFQGVLIMILSLGLASLGTDLVDDPFRLSQVINAQVYRKILVVLCSLGVGSAMIFGLDRLYHVKHVVDAKAGTETNPGAKILTPNRPPLQELSKQYATPPIPDGVTLNAGGAWHGYTAPCETYGAGYPDFSRFKELVQSCSQISAKSQGGRRVVAIGNSHLEQINFAVDEYAKTHHWEYVLAYVGGCDYSAGTGSEACRTWSKENTDWIINRVKPQSVIILGSRSHEETTETLIQGQRPLVDRLLKAGIKVIMVRDNPRFKWNMYECTQAMYKSGLTNANASGCKKEKDKIYNPAIPQQLADMYRGSDVHLVDLSPYICTGNTCPGLVGNIYVYRDKDHLSKEYAQSLTGHMNRLLDQAFK